MSSTPEFDPYAVLGVQKDATLADLKTARRELAFKHHPDKVGNNSSEMFQNVQKAFEILSDPTERQKYDQKVRINELRREMAARNATAGGSTSYAQRSSTVREYRDGRIYEERTPADVYDDVRFTKESRSTPRKNDEFGMRQRTRASEEKKKTKSVPVSSPHPSKDTARSSSKTTHTDRAKYRTKERRREAYEKMYASYAGSEDDASDSSASSVWVRVKRPSTRSREPSSRKTKPAESSRRSERRYEEDYSDEWDKHEKQYSTAENYIRRSKGTLPVERESRQRSSRSPNQRRGYESADPESSSSRRAGRSKRSTESVRPDTSRHGSYEDLESYDRPSRSYEAKVPPMPTSATASGMKVPSSVRPSLQPSRSATASYSRSKREGSSRSDPVLLGMVYSDPPSRTAKVRGVDKSDSGYSSPGTPEMAAGENPPKMSARYKVFNDKLVNEPETILVEPGMPSQPHPSPRHSRTYLSPQERLPRAPPKPVRSSTYAYTPEPSKRYEQVRPETSRQSSSRQLFGEVDYSSRLKEKEFKYAREIGPDKYSRHHYDSYHPPPVGRRQSTYT
ncbi:hypothetical protein BDV30DRAFT_100436 [Aspergillus minisclerotigenes]|uniref:J domain-containing protein n=1 Tax=Aspergillus minisclerotigenes TaxID=656917 RepID=A0A5N6JLG3_9EURO|nr:hypothetical protein BDV30DRAFT_100436 [Aspergillus minisclerotigenes]